MAIATASQTAKPDKASGTPSASLRMAIGVATRGRPKVLLDMLDDLRHQSRPAETIQVAYVQDEDVGEAPLLFPHITFLKSEPGLTRQRNTVLRALTQEDVVTFLDDDFYIERNYLERLEEAFLADESLVVATGKVLADGIHAEALEAGAAKQLLLEAVTAETSNAVVPVFNAYGCNMSLRLKPIREHGLQFDEDLPLYGWYEDVEFSRQLAQFGTVMRIEACRGVHLGVKSGRQSGLRLGYSQIANPYYLARRRRVSWSYASCSMVSRSLKNIVRSIRPEPLIDRRGRLSGNVRGWRDLLRGSLHPAKILDL